MRAKVLRLQRLQLPTKGVGNAVPPLSLSSSVSNCCGGPV